MLSIPRRFHWMGYRDLYLASTGSRREEKPGARLAEARLGLRASEAIARFPFFPFFLSSLSAHLNRPSSSPPSIQKQVVPLDCESPTAVNGAFGGLSPLSSISSVPSSASAAVTAALEEVAAEAAAEAEEEEEEVAGKAAEVVLSSSSTSSSALPPYAEGSKLKLLNRAGINVRPTNDMVVRWQFLSRGGFFFLISYFFP